MAEHSFGKKPSRDDFACRVIHEVARENTGKVQDLSAVLEVIAADEKPWHTCGHSEMARSALGK